MAKSRTRKNKAKLKIQKKQSLQNQTRVSENLNSRKNSILYKFITNIWTIITVSATILSILAILAFSPRISISSVDSLDSSNPLATPFIISNEGLLPIYNVEVTCGMNDIKADGFSIENIEMKQDNPAVAKISPLDKETTLCAWAIQGQYYEKANMNVIVDFQTIWIPYNQRKVFPYVSYKDKTGILRMLPQSQKLID